MKDHHYTECGLDNVIIEGCASFQDDAQQEVLTIPNINGLHHAIAKGIVQKNALMSGKELRFLRTEMGMTQAELACMIHREPLTVSRWERGESEIEQNAETIVRLHANSMLQLGENDDIATISKRSVPSAFPKVIKIDGTDPSNYHIAA